MTAPGPTYEVVLQSIEGDLRSGRLQIGDRLPPERALAEQFGISRASVREALRVLDAMGVVRSRRGTGPASGGVITAEAGAALGWALRLHIATRALPVRDIVDTRILLETRIARESLPVVDDAAHARIVAEVRALVADMDAPELPQFDYHRLDAQLHLALASISTNVVFHTVLASLREATIGYVAESSARLDWPSVRDTLQEQHRGIVDAFEARDADRTATLLAEHISWFSGLRGD